MPSTSPLPLCALEKRSRDLAPLVRGGLASIAAEPGAHARFLNALSLAEHIGSRKIMGSLRRIGFGQDALKHLAEETRHAFHFKRAAERVAGRALDFSAADTMAGVSVRAYMGRLEAHIAGALEGTAPALPYLAISLIVELRAVWLYRIYGAVPGTRTSGVSLASVLAEEEAHLDAMLAQVFRVDGGAEERIARFAAFEDTRFRALWLAIEADSALRRAAAE